MPILDDSLSTYKSPDYDVDEFQTFRDGKTRSSYIYARYFNQIASAIYATQVRARTILYLLGVSGEYTVRVNVTPTSGALPSSGYFNYKNDYYYGIKSYDSGQARICSYCSEKRHDPGSSIGPIPLNKNPRDGKSNANATNNTYTSVTLPLRTTPYFPRPSNDNPEFTTPAQRVIIGSSRSGIWAQQRRPNHENRRVDDATGSFRTQLNNLGPGALFTNGTLFVPGRGFNYGYYVSAIGANFGPWHYECKAGTYYSHVLVIGPKTGLSYSEL
jgi:hypothetical protein